MVKNLHKLPLQIESHPERGFFFAFEGLDGCGKTTQCLRLEEHLRQKGYRVQRIQALPTSRVRESILSGEFSNTISEALLFLASFHHVNLQVRELLNRGTIVITDRWYDSFRAYQGYGMGLLNLIDSIEKESPPILEPDLSFFLDLPVGRICARVAQRSRGKDVIESRSVEYFEKVRDGFVNQSHQYAYRSVVISAVIEVEAVEAVVHRHLKRFLGENRPQMIQVP